jgi:uncharacterized HhH-GPD family protein
LGLGHTSALATPVRLAASLGTGFGFLVAVIADYGIPAERAWAVPGELQRRLGTLDPELLTLREQDIRMAFRSKPMLHRFPDRVGRFVHAAASLIAREYGGDARRVWANTPDAAALQDRLERFDGIGQKKAAMAVDLLMRELEVSVATPSGNDVAYDVHVRRVFLRTGIVLRDERSRVINAGRELAPDHPAALDFPAWYVGRTFCRPTVPVCERCPLEFACLYAEEWKVARSQQLLLFPT